jgi:DNA polymerase V
MPTTLQPLPVADLPPVYLPLTLACVAAGFPSPAEDHMEATLDLTEHLVRNRTTTFFLRATGTSMLGAGIHPGDLLIVDRSLPATDGRVVVAVLDGEFVCKRLRLVDGRPRLLAENPDCAEVIIRQHTEFSVWGVATFVIHSLR